MYTVISGRRGSVGGYLSFVVVGSAFWGFVQQGFADFAKVISEDRGWFHTLKYIVMSPHHMYVFLTGRALPRLVAALVSIVIVLAVATLVLHLPINPLHVDYPLLLLACLVASVTIIGMGATLRRVAARLGVRNAEIASKGCSDRGGRVTFSLPLQASGAISAGQAHIGSRDDDRAGTTVQRAAGHAVASIFSVVHADGGSTALYTTKAKFGLYDREINW